MQVQVISTKQVLPETWVSNPQTLALSILNLFAVAGYAAATWFFDADSKFSVTELPDQLASSIAKTLNIFPQFCGRLETVEHKPDGDHTQRFNRLQLSWGIEADEGIKCTLAKADGRLDDLILDADRQRTEQPNYDSTHLWAVSLLPQFPAHTDAPTNLRLSIQVTQFARGGFTVGMLFKHAWVYGVGGYVFIQNWSNIHTTIFSPDRVSTLLPAPQPVLDPQMLDAMASGDIDAPAADPALVAKSKELPPLFEPVVEEKIKDETDISYAQTAERTVLTTSRIFHLTKEEVHRIRQAANTGTDSLKVSYSDAISAHMLSAICRAKNWDDDEPPVRLCLPVGVRARLDLPVGFLGSPTIMTAVKLDPKPTAHGPVGGTAAKIAGMLSKFGVDEIRAFLHAAAYETDPRMRPVCRQTNSRYHECHTATSITLPS